MSSSQRHRRILRDNIRGITSPSLRRIALRTGYVKSQSKSSVEAIKNKLKSFLEHVIRDAVTYTAHAREKTVSEKAVEMALNRQSNLFSKKILGSPPSKRCESYSHARKSRNRNKPRKSGSRKSSRGVSLQRKIRFYQKQHDCLHLPKTAVSRLIREVGQDFKKDLRWSSEAISLLHYAIELYIESLFRILGMLSIHRGGKGAVREKDILALEAVEKLLSS
jgi:histone H4